MMRAEVAGRQLEGQPLWWDSREMLLLGRDGTLYTFAPHEAQGAARTGTRYVPFGASEMQALLREEFGKTYEVSTTQHFVVVHPRGRWNAWTERLEHLYRRFVQALRVRGFPAREPAQVLPAIVFRNQAEYYRYAAAGGTPLQPGTLGHYDPVTNRIFLFDAQGEDDGDWAAATIVHEAAHQTAYNVGVHGRFCEQPRWLVEGLAMMFESPRGTL
jgi:hypothetical protein